VTPRRGAAGQTARVESGSIVLPRSEASPFRSAARRLAVAIGVLFVIATIVWLDRDGYKDVDGDVTWLDGLYYATVTASTTGYGDIAPVTDQARLVNILLITPLRVLFVVSLIGSAFEVVTTTARHVYRRRAYERTLHSHTVIIGYGTRGRAAAKALLEQGKDRGGIVAIDRDETAVAEALSHGLAVVHGDATRDGVQRAAFVHEADQVIIAVSQDATSVLATLTSRRLAPTTRIISSVREAENVPLLHDSGADSVVVSSATAGRLLGVALMHPPSAAVISDLLRPGQPLSMQERAVDEEEVGRSPREMDGLVVAVVRDGRRLPYFDERIGTLQPNDRLVLVERSPT
jgi:voltage-gated potassium channel